MRIAAFQFEATENLELNYIKIENAIKNAAEQRIDFLLTQECALTGYPPIERNAISTIDFEKINKYEREIIKLAIANNLGIAIGTIEKNNNSFYNTLKIIDKTKKHFIYRKRALWGWDSDNFKPGTDIGIHKIENINLGFRICYEIRFPEYFRELFISKSPICLISFSDTSTKPNDDRYNLIIGHLQTRAVENCIYIISANSISNFQTAPTIVIDPNGKIITQANKNKEEIIYFDYQEKEFSFGPMGRIIHSKELLKL